MLWKKLMGEGELLFSKLPMNSITLLLDASCVEAGSVVKEPGHDQEYLTLAWREDVVGQDDVILLGNGYNWQQVVEMLLLHKEQATLKCLTKKIVSMDERPLSDPTLKTGLISNRSLLQDVMLTKGLWLADVYDQGEWCGL
jgi:hypothetical protein